MPQPSPGNKVGVQAVTKNDFLALATLLTGRDSIQRVQKKDPHSEAVRTTAQMYGNREYVAAYECFKPVYDKVVADMQRVLARNLEFEANKVATQQRMPLAAAKEHVQKMKVYAQQLTDQFDRLRQDLENKPLVRAYLKKGGGALGAAAVEEEAPPTTVASANETRIDSDPSLPVEIVCGNTRYRKAPYRPPEKGSLYCVRDKASGERIIRVIATSPDCARVQVEILEGAKHSKPPVELSIESLARQAAKGWCSSLVPITEDVETLAAESRPIASETESANATMRLDIQNFSRCCADIVRANIKFDTQLIKDVGDGPFRYGDYEQAFRTFEQFAVGFTSAVAGSRREIADGRRALTAEKGKLSGKEIQERTAAFVRSEQLINTAERSFATILEGLRMYLRAQQG
jgi:hypothetical protein